MLRIVLVACFSALALGQISPETTTHQHPTHPPTVDHKFVDTNISFLKDTDNKALILKSDSGCYVTHLHDGQVEHLDDIEKLLHLESEIIHRVRHAHHFIMANEPSQYSSEVQSNCPKLYAYHKEH